MGKGDVEGHGVLFSCKEKEGCPAVWGDVGRPRGYCGGCPSGSAVKALPAWQQMQGTQV